MSEKIVKCGTCGHEQGYRRNIVRLDKWLCGCECHLTETVIQLDEDDLRYPTHAKSYVKSLRLYGDET